MIRPREIRIALVGALLFIAAGSLQACNGDSMGPEEAAQSEPVRERLSADGDEGAGCTWVKDVLVCK